MSDGRDAPAFGAAARVQLSPSQTSPTSKITETHPEKRPTVFIAPWPFRITKHNKSSRKKDPCRRERPPPRLFPKAEVLFPRPRTLHISPQPRIHLPQH